jgi:DNA-binding transcriptional LysR family regulator
MIAVRLTPDVPMFAVASPRTLRRTASRRCLHTCINMRASNFPGSGAISRWQMQNRSKKLEMAVEGPLISNFHEIVLAAALQGMGIMYAYDHDGIDEALAAGRLTRVLADWSPISPGLFLYYSNRHNPQPALRAFIDCMVDRQT